MQYSNDFKVSLFIVGAIGSCSAILGFTLPLLAFEISQSGAQLALIKGAGFIPNIFFAIFIGVINDRMLKVAAFRRYCLALSGATALLLLATFTESISISGLVVFMVILKGLAYAIGNAQMTLLKLTVPEGQLSDATALTSTVHAVISTIGPAVAGFALLQFGHTSVIAICTLLMLATWLGAQKLSPTEVIPKTAPFWPSLVEGWQVLKTNRELVMMTVVIVLTNAAEGAFATGLILKLKTNVLINGKRYQPLLSR